MILRQCRHPGLVAVVVNQRALCYVCIGLGAHLRIATFIIGALLQEHPGRGLAAAALLHLPGSSPSSPMNDAPAATLDASATSAAPASRDPFSAFDEDIVV